MATIWDVLGIAPTTDANEIRRAYAQKLKQHRPDKDPQGFQQLREAFDSAKRYSANTEQSKSVKKVAPVVESPPLAPMVDDAQSLMAETACAPDATWRYDALHTKALELAVLLVDDELAGRQRLHDYLERDLPDALEARRVFSLALAETLGSQPGLYRSTLHEVSAIMDWGVDNYRASHLTPRLLQAFEEQIVLTEQDNYWQFLARQYGGSRLGQLKWRLLSEKGATVSWWARLIPDFLQGLAKQVGELRGRFPGLISRLNPELLTILSRPSLALSWGAIIGVFFWGYTAWLPGHESPKMAMQAAAMLLFVFTYLWGYPALVQRYPVGTTAHKISHAVFWLTSLVVIGFAIYRVWYGISRWKGNDADTMWTMVVLLVAFVITPILWTLWKHRHKWRALPVTIMIVFLMFPILFIRGLPPLVNLLGMMLLPMLYGIVIQMTFFVW